METLFGAGLKSCFLSGVLSWNYFLPRLGSAVWRHSLAVPFVSAAMAASRSDAANVHVAMWQARSKGHELGR